MKIEIRPKHEGVKLHLDGKETQELLDWYKLYKSGNAGSTVSGAVPLKFTKQVAKAIKQLLAEHPDMLTERTPEQVKAALLKDKVKIEKQLKAGAAWKEVE